MLLSLVLHRDLLTAYLIAEARERYPDQINFHVETQLEGLSVDNRQATFRSLVDGSCSTAAYDFLIGADGTNSRCIVCHGTARLCQVFSVEHTCMCAR